VSAASNKVKVIMGFNLKHQPSVINLFKFNFGGDG
jgi:hypothetical protein